METYTIFVDFEAFQHGAEHFKPKELCIVSTKSPLQPLYFVFKHNKKWSDLSPEQQRTYSYETQHLHHLKYDEGGDIYCRVCVWRSIKKAFPEYRQGVIFYVFGQQKVHFLSTEFPKVIWRHYDFVARIDDLRPFQYNFIRCIYKPHGARCACLKCYRMYNDFVVRNQ